ncbi:hypothetical protein PENTCL1PPCAC_17881, partial [Pristionchus entomophagus]
SLKRDPSSVHASWDAYFKNVEAGCGPGQAFQAPPLSSCGPISLRPVSPSIGVALPPRPYIVLLIISRSNYSSDPTRLVVTTSLIWTLWESNSADLDDTVPPELELSFYGLSDADLDRQFLLPPTTYIGGEEKILTLREIVNRLKSIYCNKTGIEYMHLTNFEQQEWIRKRFEAPKATELSHDQKKVLFKRLIRSTKFEEFLAKKWPSEKRFGLEGCEVLIPAIKQVIDTSSSLGVDSVVIGMPHRGRLNVLANVCRQPLSTILSSSPLWNQLMRDRET